MTHKTFSAVYLRLLWERFLLLCVAFILLEHQMIAGSLWNWSWFAWACHSKNRPLRPLARGPGSERAILGGPLVDGEWAEHRQSSRAGVKISTLDLLVLIPVKTSPSARLQTTQQGANTWAGCCETAFAVYKISALQTAQIQPFIHCFCEVAVRACKRIPPRGKQMRSNGDLNLVFLRLLSWEKTHMCLMYNFRGDRNNVL